VHTVVCGVLIRGVQTRMLLGSRRRQGLTSAAGGSAWCLCRAHRTWPTRMESGCHQILGETRSCQLLEKQHDSVPQTNPRLISLHRRLISVLRPKRHPLLLCCLCLLGAFSFLISRKYQSVSIYTISSIDTVIQRQSDRRRFTNVPDG